MKSPIESVFPTYLYRTRLPSVTALNRDLKQEIQALETIDDKGVKWSQKNYIGGYSSYASMCQLHLTSPNFAELERRLTRHVRQFVNKLNWDLMGRQIKMTTCWANSMGPGTYHTLHVHPGSVISGVYYVEVPPGASGFKIEDPRMTQLMAAPPRKSTAPASEQNYMLLKNRAGDLTLFESWLRHEVPPHRSVKPRLSISFNYEWL